MYSKGVQMRRRPLKIRWRTRFGPWAVLWRPLMYRITFSLNQVFLCVFTEARFKKLEKRWWWRKSLRALLTLLSPTRPYLPLSQPADAWAVGRMWTETETTNSQSHLDTWNWLKRKEQLKANEFIAVADSISTPAALFVQQTCCIDHWKLLNIITSW